MEKVLVIVGQTAVGKTNISIKLAKALNGEIINGDAMQVYKGLNILTAKIKEEEKEGIPHHLFDLKEVTEDYNVDEYQANIRDKISEITSRGKLPILVGGTGLYVKSALYDYNFSKQEVDNKEIEEKYKDLSNDELYEILLKIDPKSCETIHKNNRRRVLRAIAIYETTGTTKSKNIEEQEHKLIYDAKIFALTLPKEVLIDRINLRVDIMVKEGLVEEVKNNPTTSTASKAIGYKEIKDYLDGNISKEEAIELIKIHTRQYAKRQMTWFKHQFDTKWVLNDKDALDNILKIIKED